MYYLIENQFQLDYLTNSLKDECYINIITLNSNYHPVLTSPSLIYLKPKNQKGYIVCINHSESFSVDLNQVNELIKQYNKVYVLDSKYHLYFLPEVKTIDVNFNLNRYIDQSSYNTKAHDFFYRKYPNLTDIERIIPISKHYEKQENIFNNIKDKFNINTEYQNKLTNVFFNIEKNGIGVNDKILTNFNITNTKFSIKNNIIYTRYNLYNLTTRPTNSFNNIHFSSLTKDSKESFQSINKCLIEYDYKEFHPRLIASLIKYEGFKSKSVYYELAKYYYNTDKPTIEQIQESKILTFKQLYGYIESKYLNIEFFKLTNELIENEWIKYNKLGYLELFGDKHITISSKHQLLSYLIQSYETYYNVQKISELIDYIRDRKSKIVNYNYDSLCLDVHEDDGKDIVKYIKESLSIDYPTKITYGENYKNMEVL